MLNTNSHCLHDPDTSLCALTNTSLPSLLPHCLQSCLHRIVLPAVLTICTKIFGLLNISCVFNVLRFINDLTFLYFPPTGSTCIFILSAGRLPAWTIDILVLAGWTRDILVLLSWTRDILVMLSWTRETSVLLSWTREIL